MSRPWFARETGSIRQARYRAKQGWNEVCPIPGCYRKPTDAHHTLVRRDPDDPMLYHPYNITMVCSLHHVPEHPRLGYYCMRYKFRIQGYTPELVELWLEEYNEQRKCNVTLPEFYYEAVMDCFG